MKRTDNDKNKSSLLSLHFIWIQTSMDLHFNIHHTLCNFICSFQTYLLLVIRLIVQP